MTELMDDLGGGLRRAREQSGLTLKQIADATKLSVRNLTALENNRVEQLPGGIYRRAIVRSYAAHVGLDPEQTLRAFLAKHPDDVPTWADLMPTGKPEPRRRPLHTILSAMGALIPVFAAVFYFTLSARGTETPQHLFDVMPGRGDVVHASMIPTSLTGSRSYDAVAMMVSVSSSTALQIVADGREVAVGRFEAGEVIRLTLGSDVVLVGDNAGAVHFSINGRAGRTLGESGSPLAARISRSDYQDWLIQP
jgi:transcriptional regulator with XRE-family HTH domain